MMSFPDTLSESIRRGASYGQRGRTRKQWMCFVRSPDLRDDHWESATAGEVEVKLQEEIIEIMVDIFRTICTSEEEFHYVNMPIFPEGNKAGDQYGQVPAMMIEAMVKAWTKLQASSQSKTRLLKLKGIIMCCTYAKEAEHI